MNKIRRQKILRTIRSLEEAIQDILYEEQEAYDNMPESLQASENGMNSEEAQENLEAAIDALEEAISYLEEIG